MQKTCLHGEMGALHRREVLETSFESGFQYWITPHRSLTDREFTAIIGVILTVAVLAQLFFLAIGIWLVGFMTLFHGLFLAAAFVACRRDRKRLETVTFKDGILEIRRLHGNGQIMASTEVAAYGLEVVRTVDPDFGMRKLELRQHGKNIEVGCDLSPGERESFSKAFGLSLSNCGLRPRFCDKRLA